MAVLVDLNLTAIEFLKDGKIYQAKEIIKHGKGYAVIIEEREEKENLIDEVVLDNEPEELLKENN